MADAIITAEQLKERYTYSPEGKQQSRFHRVGFFVFHSQSFQLTGAAMFHIPAHKNTAIPPVQNNASK